MTNQEAFDKAATHLLAQGCKALSPAGTCLYRGPNGTMCAVGCLIPDEEYSPGMEGKPVFSLDLSDSVLSGVNLDLLDYFQSIHDNEDIGPEDWPEQLREVATRFKLSTENVPGL